MVIGGADMLGFSFARNFDMPFAACSIQDFWRRWHISLSTWFRDYVYIPLGGNRRGKLRTAVNKSLVFLLTGLWHGASMTFVVWGLIHGFFILLETYGIINTSKWKIRPLRYIYTMFVVITAFIFFRADTFDTAFVILRRMFVPSGGVMHPYTWTFFAIALLAASAVFTYCRNRRRGTAEGGLHGEYICLDLSTFSGLTVFFTFVGLMLLLACFEVSGFIYAQF